MSCRLALITEIIAPYRIPVFNALAQQPGIDLHVIFLAETDPTQRQWLVYKEEIQFSWQVLPSWRKRIGKHNLLLNWGVGSALRRAAPDAIVCGGYNYLASWQSAEWSRRNRVPFLLWVESTTRDSRGASALVETLKAKFLHDCDGFVVPGKSAYEYLLNYGAPEESIFTAPNAVDTDFFEQRAEMIRKNPETYRRVLRLPAHYFLFAGRLVPEKGVADLLEAYAALAPERRNEFGLVIVGDGVARPRLEKRAEAAAPGCVRFAGFAQRGNLAGYYALADMFVLPTYTDPWGLVVNEAMACGLPVIVTTAAGCVADLVEDHGNGRVICAGDVDQLASVLEELAGNAELRSRMGQRSRERIRRYSPDACAAGIAKAALACGGEGHA